MNKNWQQLKLSVNKADAFIVADQLTAMGALATTFASESPQNYINHEVGEIDFTGNIEVSALFATDFDRRLIDLLFDQHLADHWEVLDDHDWQNKWKEGLKPINFHNRLQVVPSWQEETSNGIVQLKLDPGAAFGTGAHATTYLCLEWIAQNIHGNEVVIDFGCGSGILGIAAKLLGASRVLLTDCDQLALDTSIENAHLNSVQVETYLPADMPIVTADVLVANILAPTLKQLYPTLLQHTHSGSTIVLSGILSEQAHEIAAVYAPEFKLHTIARDEWVLMFGIRI